MKLSMSYPTSNPVLNMKTALNIQYISGIKPLPSISLLNYHEAHHHPVCTLVLNSDTIFLLGVSLGPCILTTCREKKKETVFLIQLSWLLWQQHWLNPKCSSCTASAWMSAEDCFVFWPWLADSCLVVGNQDCCCQVLFLRLSLGVHHAFPCHVPLMACLHFQALSHRILTHFHIPF